MATPLDGRRLFVHPAHGRIGISPASGGPLEAPAAAEGWQRSRPARVGFLVGSAEEGWDQSAAILFDHLREKGVRTVYAINSSDPFFTDCLVLLGEPELRHARRLGLEAYCRQGGALVAMGSADRAVPDWPTFAEAVLGGRDEGSGRNPMPLEVEPAEQAWEHPVLAGVEPFVARGDPRGPVRVARAAEILLWGFGGGLVKPLAWAWRPRGRPVFYSLLGSPDDLRQPDFLRLMANAVRWAADAGPSAV
ncbi:MAG: ThuA domain-containing protein [Thermoguttaceae bacterium]|jgi:hypothetical protein